MPHIGVISDTHGLVRPEALDALQGVERIIHAGDIGKPAVIEQLAELAPVTAVRGNIDRDDWANAHPERVSIELAGRRVLVLHDRNTLGQDAEGHDLVITGHSHKPLIERVDGVLYVNPGSAGPRRFHLPVAVARLDLSGKSASASIVTLQV